MSWEWLCSGDELHAVPVGRMGSALLLVGWVQPVHGDQQRRVRRNSEQGRKG